MNAKLDGAILEFFAEAEEILQRVSSNLSHIEQGKSSQELLDELYRDMHTMKGSAQLFGLNDIGGVAHAIESCLDPVRRKLTPPNTKFLDALYSCVGLIERQLEAKKNGTESVAHHEADAHLSVLIDSTVRQFGSDFSFFKDLVMPAEKVDSQIPAKNSVKAEASGNTATVERSPESKEAEADTGATVNPSAENADSTIRVQVGLLDMLMNLVGEMVLVRNQVLQHSSRSEDLEFLNLSQRLDVVTSELQDQVMKTRMQPIGNILGKFQRLIRDLARELNKKIDLTLQGKDTELDKTLLEAIKDPLTHIVRNSCDHGVETPSIRKAAGKPETGHVLIRSYHEGGQVIVEISDDGAGLNRKKIVGKAIDRGILTAEAAERMPDREKLNLIFHPGLSTAEQVSAVSGRGVGMDVVKTNIERIGGSVELDSVEGRGSTIRLKIPLTLAIVPAMLIRSGQNLYAIPQIKLVELVRVEQDSADEKERIQFVQGKPVFELRGKLLPLIDLRTALRPMETKVQNSETINIVVLNAEGDCYGLIVDEVLDTADIVVKPLSKFLKSLEVFSAATILGSGRVALILDPAGLAKISRLVLEKKNAESDFQSASSSANRSLSDDQEYLLFRLGNEEKFCVPLAVVSRLEEFPRKDVEFSGDQMVIQYRNSILPLIGVGQALKLKEGATKSETLPTIVIQRSDRVFGLVVDEILDVCISSAMIDDSVKDRAGVLGNLIYEEEVVVVVDALSIIQSEMKRITGNSRPDLELEPKKWGEKFRVLYAEDVGFFRRQVSKLLTSYGFEVIAAEDGRAALAELEASKAPIDLILSDIEMPNMNGYEFARSVRGIKAFDGIPLVALTTKFSQRDIDEGMKAGFTCYLEKLNPDILISNIESLLKGKIPGRKGSAA